MVTKIFPGLNFQTQIRPGGLCQCWGVIQFLAKKRWKFNFWQKSPLKISADEGSGWCTQKLLFSDNFIEAMKTKLSESFLGTFNVTKVSAWMWWSEYCKHKQLHFFWIFSSVSQGQFWCRPNARQLIAVVFCVLCLMLCFWICTV